ncbi:MAG TPA: hypothetical protein VM889_12260 [Candidatus Thermoplasmatota archaeon]|nr:hypothetical protein [Candidatus Thermoplasmatota archaeon]
MRTTNLRGLWAAVAIGLLVAAFQFPAAGANEDSSIYGVSDAVNVKGRKTEKVDPATLTRTSVSKYKGLLLTADAVEKLEARGRAREVLGSAFASNRLLAVTDGSVDGYLGVSPSGDVPMDAEGRPLPAHAGKAYAVLASGTIATYTHAYATPQIRAAKFASDAVAWFEGHALAERTTTGTAQAHAAHWTLKQTASFCYELEPYGKLCYSARFYQNNADGSSTYDWWNVDMETLTNPGYNLYWTEWRTSTTWMTSDVNYYNPGSHLLVDWGPANAYASGGSTLSVAVGPRSGTHGAVLTDLLSWSYYIESMGVAQASNTQYSDVYVRHDFDYGGGPTTYQMSTYPGFTVRTTQGQCLYIPFTNKAEWREYTWNGQDNFYNTWINSWRQICP